MLRRRVLIEPQAVSLKVDDSDHTLWLTARQCRLNKPERDLASSQAKLNKMKDFAKVKRKVYHLYSVNLQNCNNRKRSKMKSGKLQQQFLLPRWNSSSLALIIILSSTLPSSVMVKGKPICLSILFSTFLGEVGISLNIGGRGPWLQALFSRDQFQRHTLHLKWRTSETYSSIYITSRLQLSLNLSTVLSFRNIYIFHINK